MKKRNPHPSAELIASHMLGPDLMTAKAVAALYGVPQGTVVTRFWRAGYRKFGVGAKWDGHSCVKLPMDDDRFEREVRELGITGMAERYGCQRKAVFDRRTRIILRRREAAWLRASERRNANGVRDSWSSPPVTPALRNAPSSL